MKQPKVVNLARFRKRPPQLAPVALGKLIPAPMAAYLAARGIRTTLDWRPLRWRARLATGLTEEQVLRVDVAVALEALQALPPMPGPGLTRVKARW